MLTRGRGKGGGCQEKGTMSGGGGAIANKKSGERLQVRGEGGEGLMRGGERREGLMRGGRKGGEG